MNYLSHFFLSANSDDGVHLGNFLGDIVSPSETANLPDAVMKGIYFHRFIDHFTDNHNLVLEGKRLLYPSFGKYASVILDVFFDFILIEQWEQYANIPVNEFLGGCYQFIEANKAHIPEGSRSQIDAMNAARWMDGYLTEDGRDRLFDRLARRAKFDKNFGQAVLIYHQQKEALTSIHDAFFPILMEAGNDWLKGDKAITQ